MDPNVALADTQRTVARALASLDRHARVDGITIATELRDEQLFRLDFELEAAKARIRVLEDKLVAHLAEFVISIHDCLTPVIADKRRYAEGLKNSEWQKTQSAWNFGYAQALEDFLAGELTK